MVLNVADWMKLNAKAVLERDLATLRAKHAERENALRVERLRAAGKDVQASGGVHSHGHSQQSHEAVVKVEKDSEPPAAQHEASIPIAVVPPHSETADPGNDLVKTELHRDNTFSSQPATGTEAGLAATTKSPLDLSNMMGDAYGEVLGVQGPDLSNFSTDVDFDTMFQDGTADGASSLGFDLDLTGTDVARSSDGMGAGLPAHIGSATDIANLGATTSEDINSLLPGLESLVNDDGDTALGDFSMLNIPLGEKNSAGTTAAAQPQPSSSTSAPHGQAVETATASDINFDDLFGMDNIEDGGTGEVTNLDLDDWFN